MTMIRALFIVCFLAGGSGIQAREKTSDELIQTLVAPPTSRRARIEAARKLARRPPGEVLPKLWEVHKKYRQAIADWGMDHFQMGRKVSWEEAVAITESYAWSNNLESPAYSKQEKGAALLDLLRRENTASRKASLLQDLKFCWVEGAEPEAVSILTDPKADWGPRLRAAEVLLDVTGMKYFSDIYSTALNASTSSKEWFARLLLTKESPEWKARVLGYAFDVIQQARVAHPNDPGLGYFIACAMESYLGVTFTPDKSDPKYRGKFSLEEAFYSDTVDNALKWWEVNRSANPR